MSRPNAYQKRILLAVGAFCLALVLSEGLVRVAGSAPQVKSLDIDGDMDCVYQRSDNPVLGFELKPNYQNESPDYIATYERTNQFGLRDAHRELAKPPGTCRILVVGDSVVEGYGLREQDTIPAQLQRRFDETDPIGAAKRTEVFNFGVSAYCTKAEIELLETKGLAFSPDVVVVVFVENDFDNFNREAFPLESAAQRPKLAEWAFHQSELFRLASLQFDWFGFRQVADPVAWNQAAVGDNNVVEGIRRLRELADLHQFQPWIAIWPRFEMDGVRDAHFLSANISGVAKSGSDAEQGPLIIEAIAAQCKISSFRLSNDFQDVLDDRRDASAKALFSQGDNLHPSPLGARVAAEAIARRIREPVKVETNNGIDDEMLTLALESVSNSRPDYSRVFHRMGTQLLKQGRIEEAISEFKRSLRENSENAAAHCNLGIAMQRRKDPDDTVAAEHYRKAIEIEPDSVEAHYNLALTLDGTSPEVARGHFIQAVTLKPDFVPGHVSLCRNLYQAGRLDAAFVGLHRALQLDQDYLPAWLLLATVQAKRGELEQAEATYRRVLELDSKHAEAHNNLATILLARGDRDNAIAHLKKAVAADPNHPTAARNLAELQNQTREETLRSGGGM